VRGVGLSAVQGARIAGASRIIVVDPNPARLELAGRLGATDLVSPLDGDVVEAIHGLTGGGVDLAIESVGKAAVVRQAFDALASGGRAVAVGLTGYSEEVSIPIMSLIFDKSLRGSIHGSADPVRDFPKIFELAARGELQLESMTGPDFSLEDVNLAFEASTNGSAIRPRIVFD
jgi:S-(hydroxymethyl)glutathione dehydrogenase/alcohol dehydrogenase